MGSSTEVIERPQTRNKAVTPKMFSVVFHNNNVTTYDQVIAILVEVFNKTIEEAIEITVAVDKLGHGVAGIYEWEMAEQKSYEGLEMAKLFNTPLEITLEPA